MFRFIVIEMLNRTGLTKDDWILGLQMGWVGDKG